MHDSYLRFGISQYQYVKAVVSWRPIVAGRCCLHGTRERRAHTGRDRDRGLVLMLLQYRAEDEEEQDEAEEEGERRRRRWPRSTMLKQQADSSSTNMSSLPPFLLPSLLPVYPSEHSGH